MSGLKKNSEKTRDRRLSTIVGAVAPSIYSLSSPSIGLSTLLLLLDSHKIGVSTSTGHKLVVLMYYAEAPKGILDTVNPILASPMMAVAYHRVSFIPIFRLPH